MSADRKLCVVCSKVFRSDVTTCPDDGTMLVIEAGGDGNHALRLGHVLGNYRLIRSLGEGGVGTVYEAEHIRLGRKMAIKVLHPDVVSKEMVTRFFNEARAVNEIRHPNIIEVEDFVTTPTGEHYMLMELLQGEDLRTVISREGTLSPARVASIGEQVASALAAVHDVKIIHRDLKPDNIFLVQRDGKEHCKLLDFGVAKFTDDEQGVTRAGMTMGTPMYMAPEQIISGKEKEVGPSADIYALGMVLYEALTGAPAFTGTQTAQILRAQCFEPVEPPSQRRGEPLPPVLEAAVMKCLEKAQEHRFANAQELAEALRADQPVKLSAEITVPQEAARRAVRSSKRRAAMMVPAFLMAAAAAAIQLWPRADSAAVAAPPAIAAAPAPASAPAPDPTTPATAPAAQPDVAPAPPTIAIELSSEPPGAELFVGTERTPLGTSTATASLPMSSDVVELVARFPDGTEVIEKVVPDRPLPALVLKKKPRPTVTKRATRPATRPASKVPADRDATIDPFGNP